MTGVGVILAAAWVRTSSTDSEGQLSPDGRWLAYSSPQGGNGMRVYLRAIAGAQPASEMKWQVSAGEAEEPRWRSDGKELYFLSRTDSNRRVQLSSVAIGSGPNPVGVPQVLFEVNGLRSLSTINAFMYSPSADGQRFLMDVFASDVRPTLDVILNWASTTLNSQVSTLK